MCGGRETIDLKETLTRKENEENDIMRVEVVYPFTVDIKDNHVSFTTTKISKVDHGLT